MQAKQETKQKPDNNKIEHTKNKANINTERQKHEIWEQKQKQQKKYINNQNESNLGFKNRMLGKFVWKKQANIKKGKARNRKIKKPKILIFQGADGQKAKG